MRPPPKRNPRADTRARGSENDRFGGLIVCKNTSGAADKKARGYGRKPGFRRPSRAQIKPAFDAFVPFGKRGRT